MMDFSSCDISLRPHSKCLGSGGDFIKDVLVRIIAWMKKRLHKEKRPQSITIEAVNSQIVIQITRKD